MAAISGVNRAFMNQNIKIEQNPSVEPMVFTVQVDDELGQSRHRVTLTNGTYKRLTSGRFTEEQCVHAAFRFLLERESRDEILPSFDLNVIHLYFPDFEESLPHYLQGG
ncbi:MAG: hypothetical protein U1F34_09040 [Gammaproteobacteria bacterium]